MYKPVIKSWVIVCFAICVLFSHGVNALKATQIGILEENNECNCGPNERCTFDTNGEKRCDCDEGFLFNANGMCEECDCGPGAKGTCKLDPEDKIKCECDTGYLINSIGKCQECDCGPGAKGTCTLDPEDKIKCECDTGYLLNSNGKCQDPCSDNPCKNDGVCSIDDMGYKCDCKQPYNGKQCETQCKCDKGKCVMKEGKSVCTCAAEFGVYKYAGKEECRPCNCGKESNCTMDVSFWSTTINCICKDGYKVEGKSCKGPCTNNPCRNGGTCADENKTYKCICPSDYIGKQCENKNPCSTNPCQNKGTCTVSGTSFKCDCNKPYYGKQCEKDPCTTQPCQNNSTCNVGKVGFICSCKTPFSGKKCENDPCSSNPCENGGTCNITDKSFSCNCMGNFWGDQCEKECICEHGHCRKDSSGQTECVCPLGFGKYSTHLCEECNCGERANCTFDGGLLSDGKKCICPFNFQETKGKCNECICGPNGRCNFEQNGEKQCECAEGFALNKYGMCQECDCGPKGKCSFDEKTSNKICICDVGYIEIADGTCQVPCSDNPCKNDGVCSIVGMGYKCDCKQPYSGKHCETHPCHANPCENDGACVAVENSYGCICFDPYHGKHCENGPCTNNPCKNGGTCSLDGNAFKCDCATPFSGTTCETDPCTVNPCWNGGTCQLDGSTFKCECKAPYFGKTCGEDPCTSAPCLHDGTCEVKDSSFVCHCIDPHFGATCENDPCTEEPCANGGRCKPHKDFSYTCDCIPPYFGPQCHLDPCTDNPCKNNGTCELTHSNFKCICESPYSGQLCEIDCDCGPNSTGCHVEDGKKVCGCKGGFAQGEDDMCQACDCGNHAYDCDFKNGRKSCYCSLNYAELDGKCEECVCEEGGKCEFEEGMKKCSCFPHQRYFQGKCKYCYCGQYFQECRFTDDGEIICQCEEGYFKDGIYCKEINVTDNENITATPFITGLTTNKDECSCGVNSISCQLVYQGRKVCKCKDKHAQRNQTCAATCNFSDGCSNGGKCKREGAAYFCQCTGAYTGDRCETDLCESSRYRCEEQMRGECKRRGDTVVCECPAGKTLSWLSHMCEAMCEYKTCLYGRCQVTGNSSYICICDEGFTGRHCESSLRIEYQTAPVMNLLIIGIGIVIFSIGSIIAACWVKKLKKTITEANKSGHT